MWGLQKVKGTFDRVEGSLNLGAPTGKAKLAIDATNLDTKNAKRDEHLRSNDFFHTDEYPVLNFEADSVTRTKSGASISGQLQVRETAIPLTLDVELSETDDGLVAKTSTAISREAAGTT
jgi:polyisoprenoid-binding protein YceI